MRKILLIARSDALEAHLGSVLSSPQLVSRVSSWSEAHRLISRTSPAAVVISSEFAQPSMAPQLVQINDVLIKDDKPAFLLADPDDQGVHSLAPMFESIQDTLPTPQSSAQWQKLASTLQPYLRKQQPQPQRPSRSGRQNDAPQPPSKDVESAPKELVLRLPQLHKGNLEKVPLTRILYSLHAHEATGTLELRSGSMVRRFALLDGRFTETPDHHDAAALTSAYAWPRGTFSFKAHSNISGSPTSLYTIMINGLVAHRPQRQIMDGLMPRMKVFPVATQFWEQRRDQIDWDVLQRFIQLCGGSRNLEQIFSQMGHQVTESFRAAAFARDTDIVVFRPEPTSARVHVEYDQTSNTSKPKTRSKSQLATGSNTGRLSLEQQLQAFHDNLQQMNNHEVFGVWAGCGREVVKETYYKLIKEHHPDVYGGNVSINIRNLAQRIFIIIRKAYAGLMKVEREQTVPAPDPESGRSHRRRDPIPTLQFSVSDGESSDDAQPLGSGDDKSPRKQAANRRQHQTPPIAMGRTPTDQHPSLEKQLQSREQKTDRLKRRARTSTPASAQRARLNSQFDTSPSSLGDTPTDPEVRRQKLERLQKRKRRQSVPGRRPTPMASSSSAPPTDHIQESFNLGYKRFKELRFEDALPFFEKAHRAKPDHGLYTTFYAYCTFQVDPSKHKEVRKLLNQVIDSKDRQSLPDAHLFLGHVLKAAELDQKAHRHFQKALALNPASRDAEREIRLYERRQQDKPTTKERSRSKGGGFFKNLFKD